MMLSDVTIFRRLLINKVLPSGDVPILLMSIGEDYQADQKVSYCPETLQSFCCIHKGTNRQIEKNI